MTEEIKPNDIPQPIQLTITLNEGGRVKVSGPIQNKVFCYGLLEAAKDAIRNYAGPKIEPARHGIFDFVRRK